MTGVNMKDRSAFLGQKSGRNEERRETGGKEVEINTAEWTAEKAERCGTKILNREPHQSSAGSNGIRFGCKDHLGMRSIQSVRPKTRVGGRSRLAREAPIWRENVKGFG